MSEPRPMSVDILIRHAYVITMDDEGWLIRDGAVAIRGRRIVDVGEDGVVARRVIADRTIDAHGAPVHPGLVETHLHASYQMFRGVVPAQNWEVERPPDHRAPFLRGRDRRGRTPGCTARLPRDGAQRHDLLPRARHRADPCCRGRGSERIGIRAVLGDALILDQSTGFAQGKGSRAAGQPFIRRAPRDLDEAISRLGGELRRNEDPDALVRGHIAVLGLGTASETLLREAKRRADAAGVVLNMHHAYSPADTAADRARYGTLNPLRHLANIAGSRPERHACPRQSPHRP